MALSYEFLVARADEAARDADAAVLDNVRDRALRSESAWRSMANQVLKSLEAKEEARLKAEAGSAD